MKYSILIVSFFIISATAGFAQDLSSSTEKRINLLTRVMATELGLNEIEYLRLQALNRERIVKADEIAEFYSNDESMLAQKLAELETSFDKKFKAMLSPAQLEAYAAYKHTPAEETAATASKEKKTIAAAATNEN